MSLSSVVFIGKSCSPRFHVIFRGHGCVVSWFLVDVLNDIIIAVASVCLPVRIRGDTIIAVACVCLPVRIRDTRGFRFCLLGVSCYWGYRDVLS